MPQERREQGWIGHTGRAIVWESFVGCDTQTGAVFVAILNDTALLITAGSLGVQMLPDLIGIAGG